MKIQLNGKERMLADGNNLKDIIELSLKNSSQIVAELNGEIIKRPFWEQTALRDGDTIELVRLVAGG